MTKSAIITGIVLVIFGVWLFFTISKESGWFYLYPIFSIILGLSLIFFWKSEDVIEQRKDK